MQTAGFTMAHTCNYISKQPYTDMKLEVAIYFTHGNDYAHGQLITKTASAGCREVFEGDFAAEHEGQPAGLEPGGIGGPGSDHAFPNWSTSALLCGGGSLACLCFKSWLQDLGEHSNITHGQIGKGNSI